MEKGDDALPHRRLIAANDNAQMPFPSTQVEATLKRIAQLIGRQMAREVFEGQNAANDNESLDSS